jgi:ABC-2 type transport system ATP-binding protein
LTTIQKPTEGNIKLNGFDVLTQENDVRKSFGIIFQDQSLDEELTAYENLQYHAVLYGIPKKTYKARINELLNFVNLYDRKDDLVKTFSGGMKRRIEIARGLLHEPKILFLDEPTLGLDVQTKNFLLEHIAKMNKEKSLTIFLTTHNLEEAEKIADRIAIIDKGKILAIGSLNEIKEKTNADNLEKAFLKLTGYDLKKQSAEPLNKIGFHKR